MNLQNYNPFSNFRPGQEEAIKELIRLIEDGILEEKRLNTLEVPAHPGYGKTLIGWVLANYLSEKYGIKAIYATPHVSAIEDIFKQYAPDGNCPPTMWSGYYHECFLSSFETDFYTCHCPIRKGFNGIYERLGYAPREISLDMPSCVYGLQYCDHKDAIAKAENSNFIVTSIRDLLNFSGEIASKSVAIIDDAHKLESFLLDFFKVSVPPELMSLTEEGLGEYIKILKDKYEILSERVKHYDLRIGYPKELVLLSHDMLDAKERLNKMSAISKYIYNGHPYLIDGGYNIRPLSAKPLFDWLFEQGFLSIVLMSGTPNTKLLTDNYISIKVPNIIPVERRKILYMPIANMSRKRTSEDVRKMAEAIGRLHNLERKHTFIHCNSKSLAKEFNDHLGDMEDSIFVDGLDDEAQLNWMNAGSGIYLSVRLTEGIDLYGPEYSLNIIAKLPYSYLDDSRKKRMEFDGGKSYSLETAMAIQQAAGRCSRGADDYSKTYILDSGFENFYKRNIMLFNDWFKSALIMQSKNPVQNPQRRMLDMAKQKERMMQLFRKARS
jgi:hypothetical protein